MTVTISINNNKVCDLAQLRRKVEYSHKTPQYIIPRIFLEISQAAEARDRAKLRLLSIMLAILSGILGGCLLEGIKQHIYCT